MVDKPVIWLGDSRETISSFADDARQIAGRCGSRQASS